MEGILGPDSSKSFIVDDFSFEDVLGRECFGRVCRNICKSIQTDMPKAKKPLCICVPWYD
jgi:hypothetical protein